MAAWCCFVLWLKAIAFAEVQRIVDILGSCHHNGFPVLENGTKKMEAQRRHDADDLPSGYVKIAIENGHL